MIMVPKCVRIKSDIREAEILHKPALLADFKAVGLWKSGRNIVFLDCRIVNPDATSYSPLCSNTISIHQAHEKQETYDISLEDTRSSFKYIQQMGCYTLNSTRCYLN